MPPSLGAAGHRGNRPIRSAGGPAGGLELGEDVRDLIVERLEAELPGVPFVAFLTKVKPFLAAGFVLTCGFAVSTELVAPPKYCGHGIAIRSRPAIA
jgi:hypothetical protein